jgi:hypothetical protein
MSHHRPRLEDAFLTRRQFLTRAGMGMGAMAMAALLGETGILLPSAQAIENANPLTPKVPPLPARAKRVVHFFLNGGPSHVDTFDPKPSLEKYAGKSLPGEYIKTERKTGAAFPSPFKFKKYGQSGIEISDLFPKLAECADDLVMIRSMQAEVPNHAEPSEFRIMDALRPRHAEPESSRLYLDVPGRLSDQGNRQLAFGIFAGRVSGHLY